MNVVAINGSPKAEHGVTSKILTPFLDGMRDAGAEVELFHTTTLNVSPCRGDFACWFRTPGVCSRKDDMERLLPRFAAAEIWVFATPLFVDGISGPLKNVVDRMMPLLDPFFEIRDGHCRHSLREGVKPGKIVLVSSCAFWELDNFTPLVDHIRAACRNMGREFAGALLRPHGQALKTMLKKGLPVEDVIEAARESGRQLITEGVIAERLLKTVRRQLVPMEEYVERTNEMFRKTLELAGSGRG